MNPEIEIRISQELTNPAGALYLIGILQEQGQKVEHESTLVTLYPDNLRLVQNLVTGGPGFVERKVTQSERRAPSRTHKLVISGEYRMELKDIEGLEPTARVYRVRHIFRGIEPILLPQRPGYRRQQAPRLDLHVTTRTVLGERISQSISLEIESSVDLTPVDQDKIVQEVLRRHNGWIVPNVASVIDSARRAISDAGLDNPGRLQRPYDIGWSDITYKNLIERKHAITFKADGTRALLALTSWGTFLVTGNLDLIPLNNIPWSRDISILDGEFMSPSTLWLFDSLVVDGENIMLQNQEIRRSRMESIHQDIETIKVMGSPMNIGGILRVRIKPQAVPTDAPSFFQAVEDMISLPSDRPQDIAQDIIGPIPTDGLIFSGIDQAYSRPVYKWKPSNLMTVDFFILPGPILATMGPTDLLPHPELKADVPGDVVGTVGEFRWMGGDTWSYARPRMDKATPNSERVYQAIKHLHQDPITEEAITGHSLRLMRKYHNRVKRQVYDYLASKGVGTVTDVGSGKGGDLPSWKDHALDVVAIEPNKDNVQDLLSRAGSMGAEVESEGSDQYRIVGDDWSVELFHEPVQRWLDSMQQCHFPCAPSPDVPSHALTLFNVATFLGPKILCILSQDAVRDDGIIVIMVIDGRVLQGTFLGSEPEIMNPKLVDIHSVACPTGMETFGDLGCISIRLVDSSTVTQAQTEGLVDVDVMLNTLRTCGWIPDLDIFLDKELLLGPEEAAYSRAQRLIILKPLIHPSIVVRPVFDPLPRSQTMEVKSPWGDIVRTGVPGPGIHLNLPPTFVSFFHAILQATDPQYRRLDPISKSIYASSFISRQKVPTVSVPIYLIPSSSWDMVAISPDNHHITVYSAMNPQNPRPPGIVLLQLNPTTWEPIARKAPDDSLLYIW